MLIPLLRPIKLNIFEHYQEGFDEIAAELRDSTIVPILLNPYQVLRYNPHLYQAQHSSRSLQSFSFLTRYNPFRSLQTFSSLPGKSWSFLYNPLYSYNPSPPLAKYYNPSHFSVPKISPILPDSMSYYSFDV